MIVQTEGKIYLSEQRGCSEQNGWRSFHTFNFGKYQHDERLPLGRIQVLNDNWLLSEKSLQRTVTEQTIVLLLPFVGGFEYKSSLGNGFVEIGHVQEFRLEAGMTYEVINPYPEKVNTINFIEIWLKPNSEAFLPDLTNIVVNFEKKNQILSLLPMLKIGIYEGRAEEEYELKNQNNLVFVFVIKGAFEVQNRLLHARDALELRNLETLSLEALSNNAILLLMEMTV